VERVQKRDQKQDRQQRGVEDEAMPAERFGGNPRQTQAPLGGSDTVLRRLFV
jgi:hypothetical protein